VPIKNLYRVLVFHPRNIDVLTVDVVTAVRNYSKSP
jgi:hypothetical protein